MDHIEKKILGLQKSQYEIRFPGGKGYLQDRSHASFGAIVRKRDDGMVEVLVIPYANLSRDLREDYEKTFSEVPEQTLFREIQEETGVLINKGEYFLMGEKKMPEHFKYSYLIYKFDDSNLRIKTSPYQKNIGTPFWCDIFLLEKYISKSHEWILKDLLFFIKQTPISVVRKKTNNKKRFKIKRR